MPNNRRSTAAGRDHEGPATVAHNRNGVGLVWRIVTSATVVTEQREWISQSPRHRHKPGHKHVPERDTRDTTHKMRSSRGSSYIYMRSWSSAPAYPLRVCRRPSCPRVFRCSLFLSCISIVADSRVAKHRVRTATRAPPRVRRPSEGAGRAMRVFSLMIVHSAEAYLLAAMPQSSSTAAMESLGRLSCRNAISPPDSEKACSRCKPQRRPGPNSWQSPFQPPPDCRTDPVWGQLERQHSHVCQLPDILLQRYASDNTTIYKDHVLPTPRSVAALRAARLPVLVMLREPAGSLHGWCEKKRQERRQVGCAHGMCTPTRHAHPRHTTCPHMHTACTRLYV